MKHNFSLMQQVAPASSPMAQVWHNAEIFNSYCGIKGQRSEDTIRVREGWDN